MVDKSNSETSISGKKPFKEKLKKFWDLIFSIGAITGIFFWFENIENLIEVFPSYFGFIPIFGTLVLTSITIILIVFSTIRHKDEIKKWSYDKPKGVIEYAVEPDKPKSDLLFFSFSFSLSILLIFFLLLIPIEESIETIPFVGDNLKIFLDEFIIEFSKLFDNLFMENSQGLSLSLNSDFVKKILMLSILLSFGPIYFLIIQLFRIHYKNEEKKHNKNLDKKKQFPGSGSLVVFLYFVLGLAIQKFLLDPNAFFSIGTNWILVTMILNLFTIFPAILLTEKLTKKLIKN